MHKVASSKREEDVKMKETLEQQISQHREQHQKQVKLKQEYSCYRPGKQYMQYCITIIT